MREEETRLPLHDHQLIQEEEEYDQEDMEQQAREENPLLLQDQVQAHQGENDPELHKLVEEIERITTYRFQDPILLQQAFTHHSVLKEGCHSSLERLAYLGDAILNFRVTMEQYSLYTCLDRGKLTRLRASNVDTERLARVALNKDLHKFLCHNIPNLGVQFDEFRNEIKKHPLHSCGLIDGPKILADIVESLIGAIFIDSNSSMDTTSQSMTNLLEAMISPESVPQHPVTQLQETCQKNKFRMEMRDSWKDKGEIEYIVENGQFIGRATYGAKRIIAKNRAALDAYFHIVKTHPNHPTSK